MVRDGFQYFGPGPGPYVGVSNFFLGGGGPVAYTYTL